MCLCSSCLCAYDWTVLVDRLLLTCNGICLWSFDIKSFFSLTFKSILDVFLWYHFVGSYGILFSIAFLASYRLAKVYSSVNRSDWTAGSRHNCVTNPSKVFLVKLVYSLNIVYPPIAIDNIERRIAHHLHATTAGVPSRFLILFFRLKLVSNLGCFIVLIKYVVRFAAFSFAADVIFLTLDISHSLLLGNLAFHEFPTLNVPLEVVHSGDINFKKFAYLFFSIICCFSAFS
jgi:hypothetical protein